MGARQRDEWCGRGVAIAYRVHGGGNGSAATIAVNDDGTIKLVTGSADLSGSRIALAMQAAEALGIAAEDVTPSVADTDSVGFTATATGPSSSRTSRMPARTA